MVDKEVLSQRTNHYQSWVEALARNHRVGRKGVRKEDPVRRWLRLTERANRYRVFFIFKKSLEQGPTFRCAMPKYPTQAPHTSTFGTRC